MTKQFKWLDSRNLVQKRGANEPYCSISFDGSRRIYINAQASEKLTTDYVRIGIDEQSKQIAIKPTKNPKGAFELYTKSVSNTNIHSAAVVHHLSAITGFEKGTKKFPAKWDTDENALIINLSREIN